MTQRSRSRRDGIRGRRAVAVAALVAAVLAAGAPVAGSAALASGPAAPVAPVVAGAPTALGARPASSAALQTTTPNPAEEADPIRAAQYWLDEYGVRDAWQTTRGKGVTIAIIDTGVGRSPVEFSGAVVGGADFSGVGASDGRKPVGAVDASHGSWVASLAASRGTGPDTGMIGVAPEASLLAISVGFGASSSVPFIDQVADAMRWAVDHGADVINLSFTTNTLTWDPKWDDAFQYAFDHDVVVVVAAGNKGSGTTEVGAPATIPGVLTVGGVTRDGVASDRASTQGITIGISAPSEQLLGVSADGTVVQWDGTSGAAPIVAGIVALVRAAHPDLNADNVINRVISTARSTSASLANPQLYGHGLVDASAAVSASVPTVDKSPLGMTLAEWVRLYRRAEVQPKPQPTATPAPIPELPAADVVVVRSPLLPSSDTLRYGTVPLGVGTLAAILVALGVTAAARRIRSERAQRASSR
ncbi:MULTISPECIES: S8 family serine peptidase [unclassified Microbacterium]|uniref:S8 family serine peptidase n=1 Tax=unclassified Microbacterium TaxID=2609290 RepID=UPI0025E5809B|nr:MULTISPECIES: S8 family serine peptidase [unclassified Microbacterium]